MSVITVVYNGAATIEDTLQSVQSQTHDDIEHIIVDGGSTDGTGDILKRHAKHLSVCISEPDHGIYDAMNKGIAQATGDVIGFLNADDMYESNRSLEQIAAVFAANEIDACSGDLVYCDPKDTHRIVRYYSGAHFSADKIASGWMPAHPTLWIKRNIFKKYGGFKLNYKIAGDFELIARILGRHGVRTMHLPVVLVRMRTGGISTRSWRSNVLLNKEIVRACKENGIKTHLFRVYMKYFRKLFELLRRPS